MSKVKMKLERDDPIVVVRLTPEGLKVELVGWQHNAPVTLLAGLDVAVQRAVHQWRSRFLQREAVFGLPNARERDVAEELQVNNHRRAS